MNEIGNLIRFAMHQCVELAAIEKKANFTNEECLITEHGILVLKKLDLGHMSSEKLKKYHQEGRIVFILDGHHIHFNKTFADKHLVDVDVCRLKVKPVARSIELSEPEKAEEILEDVVVDRVEQNEYDEILNVCHEVLNSLTKEKKEETNLKGKVKQGSSTSAIRLALKHLLINNVLYQMTEISRRFIESMWKSCEEDKEAQKIDSEKQRELKQRLKNEQLTHDIKKNDIETREIKKSEIKEDTISDEKRASLERKIGRPISERQS